MKHNVKRTMCPSNKSFFFEKLAGALLCHVRRRACPSTLSKKKTRFDQKKSLEHATSFITKQKIKDKIEAQPYEHRHTALLQ